MSGRRRGERSKETSSGTTAPLEHATPPTLINLTELPQCCETCAPKTPESKEQPLNVGISLISREIAPDSHRTPGHALTVPPKKGPDPHSGAARPLAGRT